MTLNVFRHEDPNTLCSSDAQKLLVLDNLENYTVRKIKTTRFSPLISLSFSSEGYTDHPEKRRKRGSLFFRKKKDKAKTKGQNSTCDGSFVIYSSIFSISN